MPKSNPLGLAKENEFLKRENKRLSSYYLDTIERERIDTDTSMLMDQSNEIDRLNNELRNRDLIINDLQADNRKLSQDLKASNKKYK